MKQKHLTLKTLLAVCLFGFSLSSNAQFNKILNKTKDNVTSSVKHAAKRAADKAVDKATEKAYQKAYKAIEKKVLGGKAMPELPWSMASDTYIDLNQSNQQAGTNAVTWLWNCGDVSEAEIEALRAKMDARYKANNKILLAQNTSVFSSFGRIVNELLNEVNVEQKRYWDFCDAAKHIIRLHLSSSTKATGNGTVTVNNNNVGMVCSRKGGGFGVMLTLKNNGGRFADLAGRGTYLDDAQLAEAKFDQQRMSNLAKLINGLDESQKDMATVEGLIDKTVFGNTELNTDWENETDRASVFASLLREAIVANTPDNIEKQAMPKAGALHASQKAKALAAAKAEDSNVIDVVITSKSWSVQRNALGVPTHRMIYGYWIYKDQYGKKAVSRSWAQDHLGGGKYSALRNYGVGTEASFYVK